MDKSEIERLVGGAPRIDVDEILRHPRLTDARKLFLDRFLALYSGHPFTVRLLIESGRFLVYHIAAVLDAAVDPADPKTWLTITRLKQHLRVFNLASDRHIDGLIRRLCSAGFMELTPSDRDRRIRLLRTTESLRSHDRDWLTAHIAPLALLYPQHDYRAVLRQDPRFHVLYRKISLSFLPLGASLLNALPDTMLFFNHAAGAVVQAELLRTAMASPGYPHAIVPYADIGDRFGVSRTHVRRMLVAAEAAGLVRLHARGGRWVEILPRQWSSYDRGLAAGMYLHDLVHVATERAAGAAKLARTKPEIRDAVAQI